MGVCGETEKNRKPKKGSEEGDENNITGIIEGQIRFNIFNNLI